MKINDHVNTVSVGTRKGAWVHHLGVQRSSKTCKIGEPSVCVLPSWSKILGEKYDGILTKNMQRRK